MARFSTQIYSISVTGGVLDFFGPPSILWQIFVGTLVAPDLEKHKKRMAEVKNRLLVLFLVVFIALSLSGCGGKSGTVHDEPMMTEADDLDVAQLVGRRPATLAELVEYAAGTQ